MFDPDQVDNCMFMLVSMHVQVTFMQCVHQSKSLPLEERFYYMPWDPIPDWI